MCDAYLYHHGIKGMKWGVRRYQNADGSLTAAGVQRYAEKGYAKDSRSGSRIDRKVDARIKYTSSSDSRNRARAEQYVKESAEKRKANVKKALKVGAAVAGTALAAYGAYKIGSKVNDAVRKKNYEIALDRGHREVQREINLWEKKFLRDINDSSITASSYKINANAIIKSHTDRANNDRFIDAAKNVYRHARSGQKTGFHYTGTTGQAFDRRRR